MANRPSLDDYVDVAERIQDFKDAHPEGSLQTLDWSVRDVAGNTFIVYRAAAYRTPDDQRPGHGVAWEPFPGGTPYTKNSELMNAETAAWGRAIIALGLVANRKLASRQEVRNRAAEQEAVVEQPEASKPAKPPESRSNAKPKDEAPAQPAAETISEPVFIELRQKFIDSGMKNEELCWVIVSLGIELPEHPTPEDIGKAMKGLTMEQAVTVSDFIEGKDATLPGSGETA